MLSLIPLRVWLVLAAVAAAMSLLAVQEWRLAGMRAALAEAHLTIAKSDHALGLCAGALASQNQAVEQWKAAAAERAKNAQAAISQASAARRKAAQLAADLQSIRPSGDECEDLRNIVDAARAGGL